MKNINKYKLVFFDLDGTLLNDKKEILKENLSEIKRIENLGAKTVLCSGRQINAVKRFNVAQTSPYLICTNGAEIFDSENNKPVYLCELDKETVYDYYKLSRNYDLLIKIDTPHYRYTNNMDFASFEEIPLGDDFDEIVNNNPIIQITLGHKEEAIIDKVISKINANNKIKTLNKYLFKENKIHQPLWATNIVNSNVSKGNAIKELCTITNTNINETIGFGDDLNDISMIQSVGYGVAMENAKDIVKQIAKEITTDNNTPGIAEVLRKLI